MPTDILQELLAGSNGKGASPELLESLGKQAASKFLKDGSSLNETIVKMAAEYPELENEHIKRIAEFANNSVFLQMHKEGEDKNVHFDVADPGDIIRDLKDGGSPAHDGKTLHNNDYQDHDEKGADLDAFSAAFQEHSGVPGVETVKLGSASVFVDGEPVAASVHMSHANPVEDVFDTDLKLRASREKLAEAHERFDLMLKDAEADFYRQCKNVVMDPDGPGMRGVIQAVKLAASSDGTAFQVLKKVAERLVKEGALKEEDLDESSNQPINVLNTEHPLVQSFAGLEKLAQEKVRARRSLQEVDEGLQKTGSFLRSVR